MSSLLAAATATDDDIELVFVLLAIVAFGVAIWRAASRDALGAILAGGIGLVLLIFAT